MVRGRVTREPGVSGPHTTEVDPTVTIAPEAAPPTHRPSGRAIGRWPFGMLAVAVLRIIDAIAILAVAAGVRSIPLGDLPLIASNPELTRVVGVVLAILVIVGLVGLLAFQRWGWVLTMVLVGLSLASDLIRVVLGHPPYLAMLLHVVAAFYLNGRAVRGLANVAPDDAGGIVDQGPADQRPADLPEAAP